MNTGTSRRRLLAIMAGAGALLATIWVAPARWLTRIGPRSKKKPIEIPIIPFDEGALDEPHDLAG